MIKTFIVGLLLGLGASAAALYAIPVVDLQRETSLISVAANGGNSESFHIDIPIDRVLVGAQGQTLPLPADLEWPDDPLFAGLRAELFKIRNENNAVIGVAARTSATAANGDVIEWVLHLPARGSLFVTMTPEVAENGYRVGSIRAGSRELEPLSGVVTERWVANSDEASGEVEGRIVLDATYIGEHQEPEE